MGKTPPASPKNRGDDAWLFHVCCLKGEKHSGSAETADISGNFSAGGPHLGYALGYNGLGPTGSRRPIPNDKR
jgi:hypothetical protein